MREERRTLEHAREIVPGTRLQSLQNVDVARRTCLVHRCRVPLGVVDVLNVVEAGPRERGFAPAYINRLTHFTLPSWQN
jgi:hypothetical protein